MSAGATSWSTPAHAIDKQACVSSYTESQRLRQDSKLTEARQELLICADASCPGAVRNDCVQWLTEVDQSLPTIVLEAHDADDRDVIDVRVFLDGVTVAESLDGKAIPIDPGAHVIRFERNGSPPHEEHLLVREGEKNRRVGVSFKKVESDAAPPVDPGTPDRGEGSRPVPALTFVFGGLGIVALGSFGVFGGTGLSARSDLEECRPRCAQSDVDSVHTKFLIADISLGVGVAALGAATIIYLLRPTEQTTQAKTFVGPVSSRGVGFSF